MILNGGYDWMKDNEKKTTGKNIGKSVDVIIPTYRPSVRFADIIERIKKQTVNVNNIIILNTVNMTANEAPIRKSIVNFQDEKRRIRYNGIQAEDDSIITFEDDEDTKISIFNINKEDFDHGATRDYGAALSDADFIVLMSQDAVPLDKRMLEHLIEPFEDPVIAASYARQFPAKDADVLEKFTKQYFYPAVSKVKSGADIKDMGMHTYDCSNTCAAYRKSIYNELGGFVVRAIYNEDVLMAAKIINAGYKVAYQAQARVRNNNVHTNMQTFQRSFDLGVSVRQFRTFFKVTKSGLDSLDRIEKTTKYLIRTGKAYYLPRMYIKEMLDWLGYTAGYNYEKIPNLLVKKFSSNKDFWNR